MFVKFSEKAQKALVIAESSAYHLGHQEVSSVHLLLALLKMNELAFTKALNQYTISDKKILQGLSSQESNEEVHYIEYSDELRQLIEKAMNEATRKKVTAELLGYVLLTEPCEAKILLGAYGVDLEAVKAKLKEKKERQLSQIAELVDLNEKVAKKQTKIIGRDRELVLLEEMLCRKEKNNAIIVGDAGVGKTALVEKLADTLNHLESTHPLFGRRVYELDLPSVLAGTKYRGDFEEKLKRIILALKEDPDAIVFIDEIHNLVDAGKAEGAIDASNILKPYLARGEITCIGATTYQEYKKYFESDPALNRRFAKIDLKEENDAAIFAILKGLKHDYETFHQINISDDLLERIIQLTNRYMKDRHQPDKSLDVLDLCCVKTRMMNHKEVQKEIIEEVIESLCGFRLGKGNDFKALQMHLQSRLFGQATPIQKLCDGLKIGKKAFLLIGPKGVGKTEMVKQTASFLNRHLLSFQMEEYKDALSLSKFTDTPLRYYGYEVKKPFLEEIRRYPETIVLLDQIHEAHPQVISFFMKLLDQKEYNDVDFSHVIFIFTTTQHPKEGTGFMKKKHEEMECPSVHEAVDEVIYFNAFDDESAKDFLEYHHITDEKTQQEILQCDYQHNGARTLLKRLKEKQDEFMN